MVSAVALLEIQLNVRSGYNEGLELDFNYKGLATGIYRLSKEGRI